MLLYNGNVLKLQHSYYTKICKPIYQKSFLYTMDVFPIKRLSKDNFIENKNLLPLMLMVYLKNAIKSDNYDPQYPHISLKFRRNITFYKPTEFYKLKYNNIIFGIARHVDKNYVKIHILLNSKQIVSSLRWMVYVDTICDINKLPQKLLQ